MVSEAGALLYDATFWRSAVGSMVNPKRYQETWLTGMFGAYNILTKASAFREAIMAPFSQRIEQGDYAGAAGYGLTSILAGMLGRTGPQTGSLVPNRTQIGNVRAISASEANAPFVQRGWFEPYQVGTRPGVFETQAELSFVRVHGPNNIEGRFMVRMDEIRGMSPDQIRQHLALEYTPTHISDVRVPVNVQMQVGRVGTQPQWGVQAPGGVQYQLLQDIPSGNFFNTRSLQ